MPESDLDLLIDAARKAGEIASHFWRQDPDQWDKPDGAGPVTEADLAVDDMLRETLTSARPGWGWLSEESDEDPKRQDAEAVFIVDPIDGTRAFVDGHRTWAHSLAIARNGVVTEGVVYLPIREKLYAASMDGLATLNGAPIMASARNALPGSNVLAARPTFNAEFWPSDPPQVQRHFRSSLAYRMCLVAEGRFDAMITLRDTWEWDVAAGTLIAQKAGARVTDRNGQDTVFNQPAAKGPGILAMAPGLADPLLQARGVLDASD